MRCVRTRIDMNLFLVASQAASEVKASHGFEEENFSKDEKILEEIYQSVFESLRIKHQHLSKQYKIVMRTPLVSGENL